jgi:hypothetical protein
MIDIRSTLISNNIFMNSIINIGYLVFLSVVAALGGFLFGYDTAVIFWNQLHR